MHKENREQNKEVYSFFMIIIIIFVIFYTNNYPVNALNSSWIEVSETSLGRQYLDKYSLIYKDKGIIEITTKYIKIDSKKNIVDKNIYRMEINCDANKYKDISVNGKNILRAKWEDPSRDKLINDVISVSCKNV
tara:strand:- start:389 stop:790 length:402 start_codon:yes stop_codon:yes gene_type:complete